MDNSEVPRSFVIKRGQVGPYLKELLHDMRNIMYPFTALKLKESKKNSIKDFISAAGIFGVSHMQIFTQTETSNYLRLLKTPKGPTIAFKVLNYSLARDVVSFVQSARKQTKIFSPTLQSAPLLIMNGFSHLADNDPLKITSLMIQSMFPPIKVQSMNLSQCKRVILFTLTEEGNIEFRHFGLSAR